VQPFADKRIRGQWDPLAHAYLTDTGGGRALADARRLLSSTKWKHGFTLDFLAPGLLRSRHEVAQLASAWSPLGVTVHATYVDNPFKLFDSWNAGGPAAHGEFQILLGARGGGVPPDPDFLQFDMESGFIDRRHTDHSLPGGNYSGIADALIDRSFLTAGQTFDRRIRANNYAAIQREMNTHAYWLPLYFTPDPWTENGRILNTSSNATEDLYWNMYAWKTKKQ
jgi:ABC-type transport system substrate-binding protein